MWKWVKWKVVRYEREVLVQMAVAVGAPPPAVVVGVCLLFWVFRFVGIGGLALYLVRFLAVYPYGTRLGWVSGGQ